MEYNEKALKRLAKRIGMSDPLWYLMEGKDRGKIYRSDELEMPIKKGVYSLVAEAIGNVLDTPEFRSRVKPDKLVDKRGKVRTRSYHGQSIRDDKYRRDLTSEDIENFKRHYGIEHEKAETCASISKERLNDYKWLKRTAKRAVKRFFPRIKLKEERELQNTVNWTVKILRDGKDKAMPAEYRSKIWRHVHEKLRGTRF